MGFNTDTFTKAVKPHRAKLVTAYRGLTAGAVVWIYATFATTKQVDQLREWVKSLSTSRTVQAEQIDRRIDALEKQNAFITGRLGLPMFAQPQPTTGTFRDTFWQPGSVTTYAP